jgi:hypothetical protein
MLKGGAAKVATNHNQQPPPNNRSQPNHVTYADNYLLELPDDDVTSKALLIASTVTHDFINGKKQGGGLSMPHGDFLSEDRTRQGL